MCEGLFVSKFLDSFAGSEEQRRSDTILFKTIERLSGPPLNFHYPRSSIDHFGLIRESSRNQAHPEIEGILARSEVPRCTSRMGLKAAGVNCRAFEKY
jgi:hypothetical protein